MDDWEADGGWEWDDDTDDFADYRLYALAEELADRFFLSDKGYLPRDGDAYELGYLEPREWWPLVVQLDELLELEAIVDLADGLTPLLGLQGVPTELLEVPLQFLEDALGGGLPNEPSGRRVGSRKLVKITLVVIELMRELPETAQAAVRAWADMHRMLLRRFGAEEASEDALADLFLAPDLSPVMAGFSMMIALTLMRWPERADGLPLPPDLGDSATAQEVLARWEALPDSPSLTEDGAGEAEALFAQGQLAHTLAQMGSVEVMSLDDTEDPSEADLALAYSRLSRAILWVHNNCRRCQEREGVACRVASNWPERPVPLLDVAAEIANMGRIAGCIRI